MTEYVKKYVLEQHEQNKKLLMKYDADLQTCKARLIAVKLMVTALEQEMTVMKAWYQDLMELRQTIVLLNPHLQKAR